MILRSLVVALVVGGAAGPAVGAEFAMAPSGRWVAPLDVQLDAPPGPSADREIRYLLVDDQVRVSGEVEEYHRLATRVVTQAGVEKASELRIDFDPSYQQLVLHHAVVVRGKERVSALRAQDVRILQRETELDRRLYDGTRTAVVFLPDVRVGDVIDYAYTLRGRNPVLDGHFAAAFSLAYSVPVDHLRVRVLWPAGRVLQHRASGSTLSPRESSTPGGKEYVWEQAGVAGIDGEDRLPPGVSPWPRLELTDFASWQEVVAWALRYYSSAEVTPAMNVQLEDWRRLPTKGDRARAALRFVQDEIRYLGIEMGERSHRPTPPGEVFARRFGDCKDKSFLLVTLLQALEIEAAPALVNTELAAGTASWLPSPHVFDHVIVRAVVDDQIRWLEPTRTFEHAALSEVVPPPYGSALAIRDGGGAFERLPAPTAAQISCELRYEVAEFGGPGALRVATVMRGLAALSLRHRIAVGGTGELQREYLEYNNQIFPGTEADGPLEIEDAKDSDLLVVRERYRLPVVPARGNQRFEASMIPDQLRSPHVAMRHLPLSVDHPVVIREDVRIEVPGGANYWEERKQVKTPAARFTRVVRGADRAIHAQFEYRSLGAVVEPADVEEHLRGLREMQALSGFTATFTPPSAHLGREGLVGLCVSVGMFSLLVLVAWAGKKQRARYGEWRR